MCIKSHVLYTVAAVVVVDKAVVVTIECHPFVAKVLLLSFYHNQTFRDYCFPRQKSQ